MPVSVMQLVNTTKLDCDACYLSALEPCPFQQWGLGISHKREARILDEKASIA